MLEKEFEQKKVNQRILSQLAINAFEDTMWNKYDFDRNAQQILDAMNYIINSMQIFTIKQDEKLYRARVIRMASDIDKMRGISVTENGEIVGFNESDSGSPPRVLVKPGRANHQWEPVLYLASDKYTALSEVRPGIREGISVATYNVESDLRILNFSFGRCQLQEIFDMNDSKIENYDYQEIYVLIQTLLTLPAENERTYYISNIIADMAKELNIDGIAYQSFCGTGYNVALWRYGEKELHYVAPSEVYLHYVCNSAFVALNDESYIDLGEKYTLLLENRSDAIDEMKKCIERKLR